MNFLTCLAMILHDTPPFSLLRLPIIMKPGLATNRLSGRRVQPGCPWVAVDSKS